jgi:hypothetical protein
MESTEAARDPFKWTSAVLHPLEVNRSAVRIARSGPHHWLAPPHPFEPGARTAWHSHRAGAVITVTAGGSAAARSGPG